MEEKEILKQSEQIDSIEDVEEIKDEKRELTDEEKKEIYIQQLKESRIKFKPIVHKGKLTINKFDTNYKEKRRKKNKQTKISRKANR
jgi:hypothetical protein